MGSLVGTRCRRACWSSLDPVLSVGGEPLAVWVMVGPCGRLSLQKVQGPWEQAHGRHHCCVSLLETECFRKSEGTPGRIVYPYDFQSI